MRTWIVVAHRLGARVFCHLGVGRGIELVRELECEAGRKRNQDIDSDRGGRVFDSAGFGRHAVEAEESPHDRVAADFAREVARTLEAARNEHRYDGLVLVAEPKFLGLLKAALSHPTSALVQRTLPKDLAAVRARDLAPHLEPVLAL